MGPTFEAARMRVSKINWEYEDEYRPSHVLLVEEFIRRGHVFLDYIHKYPDRRVAVYSAANVIGAKLPIDLEETCLELNQIYGTASAICTFYLEWAYLLDQKVPVALQFHDLYEPIMKLYERGGRISYREYELVCRANGWPRNSAMILRNVPPRDIRDEALEEYDNAWFEREITNELKKYMDDFDLGKQKEEEIIAKILEQLKAYSHTTSKEIMIKVELAHWLLNHGNQAVPHLKDIKKELEQFKIDDQLEKWLPEAEKKDLVYAYGGHIERIKPFGSVKLVPFQYF